MYPKATTLADIGITKTREARILQAIAESYSVPQSNPDKESTRKRLEAFVHKTRASEAETGSGKGDCTRQRRQKEEELETALFERRAPNLSEDSKPLRWQLTETFEPTPQSIWEDIDVLEGDRCARR